MQELIGFETFGSGERKVVVLHGWLCDHSSRDSLRAYLSPEKFTYAFVDLRGYGFSKEMTGSYDLEEASSDVLKLAAKLGWEKFSLIGYSMSGMIAHRIVQCRPNLVERLVMVTPVNVSGAGITPEAEKKLKAFGGGTPEEQSKNATLMWDDRLSQSWVRHRLKRLRETTQPSAVAQYVEMWGARDVAIADSIVAHPLLIISGALDSPGMQPDRLEKSILPFYSNSKIISLEGSGHYPMEEQPPRLANEIEKFLSPAKQFN